MSQAASKVDIMNVDVRPVPFGAPALESLNEAVRASRSDGGHPLDPAVVIAPNSSACISLRRALARRRTVGVEVLTLARLARRLAGNELREVLPTMLSGILRNVLESPSAGVFVSVAGHPSTERTLLEAHRNLASQPPKSLFIHEKKSETLRDVVGIHREVRRRLRAEGLSEESDIVAAATEALRRAPASVHGLGAAFVYLPGRLKEAEVEFLVSLASALGGVGQRLVVLVGVTGVTTADAASAEIVQSLGGERVRKPRSSSLPLPGSTAPLRGAAAHGRGTRSSSPPLSGSTGFLAAFDADEGAGECFKHWSLPRPTRIIEAPDADEEVRTAIRGVVAGLRDGVDLHRMAIVYPSRVPYLRLLSDQLREADLPFHGQGVGMASESILGRFLLGLLGLAEGRFGREELFRWLNSAPVRAEREIGVRTADLSGQVVSGQGAGQGAGGQGAAEAGAGGQGAVWRGAGEQRSGEGETGGQGSVWRGGERGEGETDGQGASGQGAEQGAGGQGAEQQTGGQQTAGAGAAEQRRRRLPVPVAAWERLSRNAGVGAGGEWEERLERFRSDCERKLSLLDEENDHRRAGIERQIAYCDDLADFVDDLRKTTRTAAAEQTWEGMAAWAKKQIVDRLGDSDWRSRSGWPQSEQKAAEEVERVLEGLAGLDKFDPNPDLARFRRSLQAELDNSGMFSGRLGHGLLISTPDKLTGVELQRVWILGMAEGVFPSRAYDDPLIAELDESRGAQARLADEQRSFLEALTSASEERTLLYPRGDLRNSGERLRSRWLDLVGGGEEERIPSSVAAARSCGFPVTEGEFNMRELLGDPDVLRSGRHPLSAPDGVLHRPMEMLKSHLSSDFTRFDGNLSGVEVPRLSDARHAVSASRLEKWTECPHAYFMRYLLGVEPLEDPAREVLIPPLERGDLVHNVLDRFFRQHVLDAPPRPNEAWSAERRSQLRRIAEEALDAAEQQGRTGHRVFWQSERSRMLRDFERFLDNDERRRAAEGWTPKASEQGFAQPSRFEPEDTHPPVIVELPDGRKVRLTGRVDRIDVSSSGGLVVIDYKTGRSKVFKGLGEGSLTLHAGGEVAKKKAYPDNAAKPKLQLPLYASAVKGIVKASEGSGGFWGGLAGGFVSSESGVVSDDPGGLAPFENEVVSGYWFVSGRENFEWLYLEIDERVEAEFFRLLGLILDGIEGGVFPSRPSGGARDHCEFCRVAPDHGENDRRFRRKAFSPELRVLQALVAGADL